jgi:hypothetical protein
MLIDLRKPDHNQRAVYEKRIDVEAHFYISTTIILHRSASEMSAMPIG